jgi:hypothetical protein
MSNISEQNISALSLRDGAANSAVLETFLTNNPLVEFIRFLWLDYSSSLIVRVATKKFALCLAQKHEPIAVPSPVLTIMTVNMELLLEDIEVGEDELWAD